MPVTQLGPYTLVSRIAQGGMATVYLARHVQTQAHVALKVLSLQASADDEFVARFRREGDVAATLGHPNIVPVLESGCDQDQLYLAMAYLPYGTVKDRLAKYAAIGERMPIAEVLEIGRQIAWALDHTHKRGLIHRDVKPSNILIGLGGQYLLSDFGVAFVSERTRLTRTDKLMVGTPAYMSPEQAEQRPFDHRVDVYALGIVLYELLTGRAPFIGDLEMMVLYGHVHSEAPALRQLRPEVTAAVAQIIARAMAKSPEARFHTAGDMALAIEALTHPIPRVDIRRIVALLVTVIVAFILLVAVMHMVDVGGG